MTNDERIDKALELLFDVESEIAAITFTAPSYIDTQNTLLTLREMLNDTRENA
jgi:hypothetical protein